MLDIIDTVFPYANFPLWEITSLLRLLADFIIGLTSVAVPTALIWSACHQTPRDARVFELVAVFVAATGAVHILRQVSTLGPGTGLLAAGVSALAGFVLLRGLGLDVAAPGLDVAADNERLRLLEAAVAASGDGVMVAEVHPAGHLSPRIVFANVAFERMMGYSVEETVGLSPSVLFRPGEPDVWGPLETDPDAESEVTCLATVRAAIRGAEMVRLEVPSRRKDGARIWAEWHIVPVVGQAGPFTHCVAVLRDTTHRRQLEVQLRESLKMDAVGRLAGGIAHDFNNLLTVICGNTDLLQRPVRNAGSTPELLEEIRGAAERATGLVRQLLTFCRRQPTRPVVLDLNLVVTGMAGILRRLLGEQIAVGTTLAHTPILARIDRGQVEQVVMNLAVNARDAMPQGGKLEIGTNVITEPGEHVGAISRFARLSVTDTGTGMSPEVRTKIFEPFFTTKGVGQGTGLGLSTVYGIVTQAGGRIEVDSSPGIGTAFHVDLPWSDEPAASLSSFILPEVTQNGQAGSGHSVLLVEDEDCVRKLARISLEGAGYAVTEAPDGETACELLGSAPQIDLLVTDLTMPGIGGRELALQVRARRPEIGVVFISGYATDIGRLDSIPRAVFLAKPFAPGDIVRASAKAIDRAE